jgi:hypothetical protein
MVHEAVMIQTKLLFEHLPGRRKVKSHKFQSEYPTSGLRFELGTSRIRSFDAKTEYKLLDLLEATKKLARRANTRNKELTTAIMTYCRVFLTKQIVAQLIMKLPAFKAV